MRRRTPPPVLFHYTCDDRFPMILADGQLVPGPDGMVWLTDLTVPIRLALGLTSRTLSCDRTAHRVSVDTEGQPILWWPNARRSMLATSTIDDAYTLTRLERAEGARPSHWWVSVVPVPVRERP